MLYVAEYGSFRVPFLLDLLSPNQHIPIGHFKLPDEIDPFLYTHIVYVRSCSLYCNFRHHDLLFSHTVISPHQLQFRVAISQALLAVPDIRLSARRFRFPPRGRCADPQTKLPEIKQSEAQNHVVNWGLAF